MYYLEHAYFDLDIYTCTGYNTSIIASKLYIITFNKHCDKENDCVYNPVIIKPHLITDEDVS